MEHHLSLRMRKLLPQNLDLTDYDRDLLAKQLDLEKVMITLTKEEKKDEDVLMAQDDEQVQYYVRTVVRQTNEEGMFSRLQ